MMDKATKEERRRQRIEEKKREAEKYPGCHFAPGDGKLQIILAQGENWSGIRIRTNNSKFFTEAAYGAASGWVEGFVPLGEISELASLVKALAARLNGLIEEANQDIRKCRLTPLEEIPISEKSA